MNKFFTSTASLSAYSKWVLICLIVDKTIGDELSKTDFIKRECPYNKFNKVVDELLNIDAISEHKVKQSNRGRPKIYYNFIYDTPNEISKLISSEILAKIEGKDLRVPIKILWCFFVLNQNEFGYIEGFTMANIATACGLESTQLKTAIKLLKNENLISQSVTGCTIKKYHSVKPKVRKGLVGSEANNLKRSSTFKLNNKETYAIYLITLPSNRKRKLNSFTTIFFSLLMEKHLKNDSIFVELLHFDNSWLDSDTKQNDEIQFLRQQPTQVFDYFDDVLFKLVSYGLSRLLTRKEYELNPISEEDAFNQILSPASFEFMTAIQGRLTSELIGSFANILIHYILFTFYLNRYDVNLPIPPSKQEYFSWVTSLTCPNKNIDIELIRTPTKVKFPGVFSIENLVISSNIDFTDKVKITNMNVDFRDPKSALESGQHPVFQCVPESFAHFYKTVITSEQL